MPEVGTAKTQMRQVGRGLRGKSRVLGRTKTVTVAPISALRLTESLQAIQRRCSDPRRGRTGSSEGRSSTKRVFPKRAAEAQPPGPCRRNRRSKSQSASQAACRSAVLLISLLFSLTVFLTFIQGPLRTPRTWPEATW